jgi:hypothetical protein
MLAGSDSRSQGENRARRPAHDLVGGRSKKHEIQWVATMDAHDDEIRVVFGCDTQNLPIRLAAGQPRLRPARVPNGIWDQFLKLRRSVQSLAPRLAARPAHDPRAPPLHGAVLQYRAGPPPGPHGRLGRHLLGRRPRRAARHGGHGGPRPVEGSSHRSRTRSGKRTRACGEGRRRRQLLSVSTGHEACLTTCCVVDPKSIMSIAKRPRTPITIRSACVVAATLRIC